MEISRGKQWENHGITSGKPWEKIGECHNQWIIDDNCYII